MSAATAWLGQGARALRGAVDRLGSRRLSILIFHRVLPEPDPLFPDLPHAAHFERLMQLLAASFCVLPLGKAAARLRSNSLPYGALCITFDDGYADNAEVALPIMRQQGLPGTFFVATGFLDGGRMFNDSVIECLRLASGGEVDLTEFGLGPRCLNIPKERRAVIDELLLIVKYLGLPEREVFIERLAGRLGVARLPDNLMMRSEQVVALHRAGMEIGGHTVRHPILSVLPDDAAEREIAHGRQRLRELTGAEVGVFAYPNGRPEQDYQRRHVEMVRRQGFAAAVSTAAGPALGTSDPFQLPRFTPWNPSVGRWMASLLRMRASGHVAELAT